MRISLLAWGSRGDVQPLVALGRGLLAAGHDCRVVAPDNFAGLVTGQGVPFEPFGIDMGAAIGSDVGRTWLEGSSHSPSAELRAMRAVIRAFAPVAADAMARLAADRDALVSSTLTRDAASALAHATGRPHAVALLAPMVPSASAAVTLYPVRPGSSVLNRWASTATERLLFDTIAPVTRLACARAGIPAPSWRRRQAWARTTPTLVGASRHLVPPPPDWAGHVAVTGAWQLAPDPDWQPPRSLADFLAAGPPPLYVGFGSMPVTDTPAWWDAVTDAVRRVRQRAIVLAPPGSTPPVADDVLPIPGAPHAWLFPRVRAVVHHGGAGTTHGAATAGVPQLVVPHMGDQPYWGRRVHELGVGVRPLPRHRLTAATLAPALGRLAHDDRMARRATELGARLRDEDGVAAAVAALARALRA